MLNALWEKKYFTIYFRQPLEILCDSCSGSTFRKYHTHPLYTARPSAVVLSDFYLGFIELFIVFREVIQSRYGEMSGKRVA